MLAPRGSAAILFSGRGFDVGEAHAVVAVRLGVYGALAGMRIGNSGGKTLPCFQVDDDAVLIEAPVDITDEGNGNALDVDADLFLIGGRHTVLAEFLETFDNITGDILALIRCSIPGLDVFPEWAYGRSGFIQSLQWFSEIRYARRARRFVTNSHKKSAENRALRMGFVTGKDLACDSLVYGRRKIGGGRE